MRGMEMMLANMIGIKPDELQAMLGGLTTAATTGVETIGRIETKLDQALSNQTDIIARLERLENGNGNKDG